MRTRVPIEVTKSEYRPDVDGLRAVAVGAVVLFHAGVSFVGGGYVGVDVFFVISGFLITQILRRQSNVGQNSILHFYERRIRRIAPALVMFFLVTITFGYILFLPSDLIELCKEILASLFFVSNLKFFLGADYWFSGLRPLLHTWSLAIEEQFYLFFPLLLIFLTRRGERVLRFTLLILWVLSLVIAMVEVNLSPSAAFFLLPSRIWELSTGAILALDFLPRLRSARVREVTAAVGLFMVIVPCLAYTDRTPFPGIAALVPCIGTAFVLQAGREGDNAIARFLSKRLIVGLGLISYSLYLYHYPFILFAKELAGTERLSMPWAFSVILFSAVVSILSWRFVEQPFRSARHVGRRALFVSAGAGTAIVAIAAAGSISASGFPGRLTPKEISIAAAQGDRDARFQECIKLPLKLVFGDSRCKLGKASQLGESFVVLGDSHAAAIASAIDPLATQGAFGGTLVAFGSCPPLLGLPMTHLLEPAQGECIQRVHQEIEAIDRDARINRVILIAYWPEYKLAYGAQAESLISSALLRTVAAFHSKQIVLLYDLPVARLALPRSLVLADRFSLPWPRLYLSGAAGFTSAIPELKLRGVRTISLAPPLCPARRNCPPLSGGHPVLVDSNHLSRSVAIGPIARYLSEQRLLID